MERIPFNQTSLSLAARYGAESLADFLGSIDRLKHDAINHQSEQVRRIPALDVVYLGYKKARHLLRPDISASDPFFYYAAVIHLPKASHFPELDPKQSNQIRIFDERHGASTNMTVDKLPLSYLMANLKVYINQGFFSKFTALRENQWLDRPTHLYAFLSSADDPDIRTFMFGISGHLPSPSPFSRLREAFGGVHILQPNPQTP